MIDQEHVVRLMQWFKADEDGHDCNAETGDLGYGWMHYGLIRCNRPKNLLCLGSRHGFIPAVMGQACLDSGIGHVDFVDAGYGEGDEAHWTGEAYWQTKKGENAFRDFGLGAQVSLHVMRGEEFLAKNLRKRYQYIYVDADHSYEGVLADSELFWPVLEEDGLMLFHDICVTAVRQEGVYGVKRFWDEYGGDGFSRKRPGSGLGVLKKRGSND